MIQKYTVIKGFSDTSIEFLKVNISDYTSPVHYHTRYCIGEIHSGSMVLECNDTARGLSGGDYFIISPFQNHRCIIQQGRGISYSVICFQDVRNLIEVKERPKYIKLLQKDGLLPLFNYACNAVLKNTAYNERIKTLLHYINDNCMGRISISQLSDLVDLSPSRLQHVFRDQMGMPLKQCIIQEKIRKSKNMILHKNLNDVTYDCGFYDQSHFNRNFKKYTGISPTRYAHSVQIIGDHDK